MDVIGWDSAFGGSLRILGSDGTTVTCASGGVTEDVTSNEPQLLDLLAAARDRNGRLQVRTIAECVRQNKCGAKGAVGHFEEVGLVLVHHVKTDEKDIVDKMGV